MTSEIAVMNQRAVALAADSAVTLVDGGTVVVRNEQRKLYQLADGKPVGLMFFGLADLMGHPWEHLIEHYQKSLRVSLRTTTVLPSMRVTAESAASATARWFITAISDVMPKP